MSIDRKMVEIWRKERDEAAYSFDVKTFKDFYAKWAKRGIYDMYLLPPDDVLEISIRKMVVNFSDPIPEKYEEAKAWLLERGYDLNIGS